MPLPGQLPPLRTQPLRSRELPPQARVAPPPVRSAPIPQAPSVPAASPQRQASIAQPAAERPMPLPGRLPPLRTQPLRSEELPPQAFVQAEPVLPTFALPMPHFLIETRLAGSERVIYATRLAILPDLRAMLDDDRLSDRRRVTMVASERAVSRSSPASAARPAPGAPTFEPIPQAAAPRPSTAREEFPIPEMLRQASPGALTRSGGGRASLGESY